MRLGDIMEEKGFTDSELAAKIGCARSTVYEWRIGTYQPRADKVKVLCEALDCTPEELLDIKVKTPPRINRSLAVGLYQSVSRKGAMDASTIHQMAGVIRRLNHNKLTGFEVWLRDIAEELYKIELTLKKSEEAPVTEGQLALF